MYEMKDIHSYDELSIIYYHVFGGVTIRRDMVRILDLLYLIHSATANLRTLQFAVTHALVPSVFISRILATDFKTVIIPVSLSHTHKYHCTTAHTKTSLHCRIFSSQQNSLDSSIICQLPTPEPSTQFSAATASSSHLSSQSSTLDCQNQSYFTTGGLPPISASWRQAPWYSTSNFIFQLNTCSYTRYVTSSMTRGWVCCLQLLLALASAVILRSESRGPHDHILLSQIRDSPNLEGQVSVFTSLRNWVPLSSRLAGYGGGIRSSFCTDRIGNTVFNSTPIIVCLPIRCLETGSYIVACIFFFARNCLTRRCLAMNYYSFQASCHNMQVVLERISDHVRGKVP
jgi:hypothetical protein